MSKARHRHKRAWRNTEATYGLVAVVLHWLVAVAVVALFGLGLWMVGLDYYHTWYHRAPDLHKGVGVLLFLVVVVRWLWRAVNPRPQVMVGHAAWERWLAALTHRLLYLLLLATMVAGYLISTAEGAPVDVFGWLRVPALWSGGERQADLAGEIHLALAIVLVALAGLHAMGAIKHHFIDRDATLLRMLGRSPHHTMQDPQGASHD